MNTPKINSITHIVDFLGYDLSSVALTYIKCQQPAYNLPYKREDDDWEEHLYPLSILDDRILIENYCTLLSEQDAMSFKGIVKVMYDQCVKASAPYFRLLL